MTDTLEKRNESEAEETSGSSGPVEALEKMLAIRLKGLTPQIVLKILPDVQGRRRTLKST